MHTILKCPTPPATEQAVFETIFLQELNMSGLFHSSRRRIVRPVAALAFAALVSTLAACGSDNNGTTGPSDVSGTYSLATINGDPLPFTVPNNPDHTIIIQSATVTLGSDNSYSIGGTGTSDGGDPEQVVADAGTYTLSGSTVTFTSSTHSLLVYTATATSTTLTESVPGAFAGSTNTSFVLVLNKNP
jgi:hypothetical protein